MSLILAIDCSARWINLGLGDESGAPVLLGESAMAAGRGQSEILPAAVESMLAGYRKGFSDVRCIAATVGPGYYTGIRVGLAYAASLAESLGIGIVPMTSLYAMAFPLLDTGLFVAPVIKARNGAVYGAVYRSNTDGDGTPIEIMPQAYFTSAEFAAALEKMDIPPRDMLLAGGDVLLFDELAHAGRAIISAARPSGAAMISAARNMEPIDPLEARAVYLRSPD